VLVSGLFLAAQPTVAQDQPSRLVRVGIYDNEPKLWTEEEGQARGIFPEVLNAIAAKEGWRIEYVDGTFEEGLARLKRHEIDIMPDVAVSMEREREFVFNSETVLVGWAALYTRDDLQISSMADLAGKKIAIMTKGIIYSGKGGLNDLLNSFAIQADIIDVEVYADVFCEARRQVG
jgi:ABC-type amino acid transport substrate-binding protein